MDFSAIYQLKTKKFWWMDIIFYFVVSSLIATVLCYLIFLGKNGLQREDIKKEMEALQTVGTPQQKEEEKYVINYQRKINDFANLLKNHEFASNVFAFMEEQTMPNIWFKQFALDEKNNTVQLSGESDNMSAFSMQVASLEKNKYVKSIGTLNSSLGESAKIGFNIDLKLNEDIFSYLSIPASILETTTPPGQITVQPDQATPPPDTAPGSETNPPQNPQPSVGPKSGEKAITSFKLLLNPEVVGTVDETSQIITLNVPYGTDVKNLVPIIVVSAGATVSPASNAFQDFTKPVIYRVFAEDGSIKSYGARVIVSAQQKPEASSGKKSGQSGFVTLIIIILSVVVIVAAVIFVLFLKRRRVQKSTFNNN